MESECEEVQILNHFQHDPGGKEIDQGDLQLEECQINLQRRTVVFLFVLNLFHLVKCLLLILCSCLAPL